MCILSGMCVGFGFCQMLIGVFNKPQQDTKQVLIGILFQIVGLVVWKARVLR